MDAKIKIRYQGSLKNAWTFRREESAKKHDCF